MQFTTLASALAFATYVLADSQQIGLMILRSGSQYHFATVSLVDGTASFNDGTAITGVIKDDGTFELDDGSFLIVNDDGTMTTGDEGSSPFSISSRYFEYQGSSAFSVDESSSNVLFGSSGFGVSIAATSTGGFADDFTPGGSSGSSAESSAASTTAETATVSSTSASAEPTVETYAASNGAAGVSGAGAAMLAIAALVF